MPLLSSEKHYNDVYGPGNVVIATRGNTQGGGGDDIIVIPSEHMGNAHQFSYGGSDKIIFEFSSHAPALGGYGHFWSGEGNDEIYLENTASIGDGVFRYGRFDDFDASRDSIFLDGEKLNLKNLPQNAIIVHGPGTFNDPNEMPQQYLLIATEGGGFIQMALEGARTDMQGEPSSLGYDENHWGRLSEEAKSHISYDTVNGWSLEDSGLVETSFTDPQNFVPLGFKPADEGGLVINGNPAFQANRHTTLEEAREMVLTPFFGSELGDLIAGGLNRDIIHGQGGNDHIWGGTQNDDLFGGSGDDTLEGGIGHDLLNGGAGADVMIGGRGNDTYYVNHINDQIIGEYWWDGDTTTVYTSIDFNQMTQADTVILTGSDDIDITTNFMNNTLVGNSGNNTIDGARGDDTISGGSGDDVLIGGHGADVMTGGRGNDTISGGSGDDIFIFKKKFGRDVISDFEESDVIDLSRVKKITSFEDLMANHLSQNGLDSVISAGKSKSITLVDVQVEELTADHFIF